MSVIQQLDDHVAELLEVSSFCWDNDKTDSVLKEYQQQKAQTVPRVMLFGSYNAGKSSLINALLKLEAAEYDDVPKTAQVAEYEWSGCYLQDTPGVNAPIEHEEATKEQIDRSELILFVIRQGDQDVNDVYERMFTMLKQGKHIFIVYNHELSDTDLTSATDRLNGILLQFADLYGVSQEDLAKIPCIAINVKTALKAGLKNSLPLAEHSGITVFESHFLTWLKQFDDDSGYFDRLRSFVNRCIAEPIAAEAKQCCDQTMSADIAGINKNIEAISQGFDLTKAKTSNFIRAEVNQLKVKIEELISNEVSQTTLESEVQSMASKVMEDTTRFIQQECEASIENVCQSLELDTSFEKEAEGLGLGKLAGDQAIAALKKVDQKAIEQLLLMGRKLKIPVLKGRWQSTLSKWAGKAAPVVNVLTAAIEVGSAIASENKHNEALRKRQLAIIHAVQDIASTIASSLNDEACKAIDNTRDLMIEPLLAELEAFAGDQSVAKQRLVHLAKLDTDLVSIKI